MYVIFFFFYQHCSQKNVTHIVSTTLYELHFFILTLQSRCLALNLNLTFYLELVLYV